MSDAKLTTDRAFCLCPSERERQKSRNLFSNFRSTSSSSSSSDLLTTPLRWNTSTRPGRNTTRTYYHPASRGERHRVHEYPLCTRNSLVLYKYQLVASRLATTVDRRPSTVIIPAVLLSLHRTHRTRLFLRGCDLFPFSSEFTII